jgi:ubiquitin conjugation factor E4 B
LAQFELGLKRYNDVLEKAMQLKFAIEGVLFDDLIQARSLQFMKHVIVFLLRLASGADWVPGKEFK